MKKPCKSIFYADEYLKFIENYEKIKIRHFTFAQGEKLAYFPYLLIDGVVRSLRYGGICVNCRDARFSARVRSAFKEYCAENKIKRVSIREDPFVRKVKIGKPVKKEPLVCINLAKGADKINSEISSSHMKCIQGAMKRGLLFSMDGGPQYLKIFYKLYRNQLDQRGIVSQKFLYFVQFFSCLKDRARLVCVKYKDSVLAISVVLESSPNVFMLYGGMSKTGYREHAKHFMIYNLVFYYKQKGYQRVVLGTGHNGRDSIYRFKKGFTKSEKNILTYELKL